MSLAVQTLRLRQPKGCLPAACFANRRSSAELGYDKGKPWALTPIGFYPCAHDSLLHIGLYVYASESACMDDSASFSVAIG